MVRLLISRVMLAAITVVIVVTVVFFSVEALPGDACTAFLGRQAQGERLATCQRVFGLDRPAVVRFADWAGKAATGDLGQSMTRKKSVNELIGYRLRNTAVLGLAACLVGIPIAIFIGILAGLWRDRPFDVGASSLAIVLMTLPEFVTGTVLLVLFAIKLKWLPGIVVASATSPVSALLSGIALPVIVLASIMAAHILRMMRSSVIDVMATDYIRMAELKGVPFGQMVRRHVVPNALIPSINLIALTIAWMLGGVVITETVFNYPGIGRLTADAIGDRDLPLVQGIALVLAGIYVGLNLLADILTLVMNPRLRTAIGRS